MIIEDGTGTGNKAKVDSHGRVRALSVSEPLSVDAAVNGKNYNINSGMINLTSGSESAVAYFKNKETDSFVIEEILVILGTSTGGSGDLEVKLIKNPSSGTIVSNAVAGDNVSNRNFGSTTELKADFYKGVEGDTLTDGTAFADTIRTQPSAISFDADVIILPESASIGVMVTPQSGNTSMDCTVAIIGYVLSSNGSK